MTKNTKKVENTWIWNVDEKNLRHVEYNETLEIIKKNWKKENKKEGETKEI